MMAGRLVLSGGPQSVFEDHTDFRSFFDGGTTDLGNLLWHANHGPMLWGHVERGHLGEYGNARVHLKGQDIAGCLPTFSVDEPF